MNSQWPLVRLGDILSSSKYAADILPDEEYKEVTVRLWGKGVTLRGIKLGSEIGTGKRFYVSPGQFIMSKIDARHGAFGVIPDELDGAVITSDFPLFDADPEKLDVEYLNWLSKTPWFIDACKKVSEGTTNRVRLKEQQFLGIEIFLPELSEQRRIVSRIRFLSAKVREVTNLRNSVQGDIAALLVAMSHRNDLNDEEKVSQGWQRVVLSSVLRQVSESVDVEPGEEYPHFGIYSFAKGLFKKTSLLGDEIKAKKLYRVRKGQFAYGRLNAYEGAFAVIGDDYDGFHVSNEFPTFECNLDCVLPEFMLAYFSAPVVWETLKRKVTGIGGVAGNRRIRLKERDLLSEEIWLPPMIWQNEIKSVMEKLETFQNDQKSVELELNALSSSILEWAFKGELV